MASVISIRHVPDDSPQRVAVHRLKVFPDCNPEAIYLAVKNRFNIPADHRLILQDAEGDDVPICGNLPEGMYDLRTIEETPQLKNYVAAEWVDDEGKTLEVVPAGSAEDAAADAVAEGADKEAVPAGVAPRSAEADAFLQEMLSGGGGDAAAAEGAKEKVEAAEQQQLEASAMGEEEVAAAEDPKESKRMKAIQEVLETEAHFVSMLLAVRALYIAPVENSNAPPAGLPPPLVELRKKACSKMKTKEKEIIFHTWGTITDLNRTFSDQLEHKVRKHLDSGDEQAAVSALASVFSTYSSFFKVQLLIVPVTQSVSGNHFLDEAQPAQNPKGQLQELFQARLEVG